jgi:hypothetical protein
MNLNIAPTTDDLRVPITDLHEFYRQMIENDLLMVYEGEFTQEITRSVLLLSDRSFEMKKLEAGLRKKVVNVMIESLQNICKHQFSSQTPDAPLIPAVFMVGMQNGNYVIITGNIIHNSAIAVISEKINRINSLDRDGLKQLYKETRLAATLSPVGGAGLGLIDMARKSGNPLTYRFDPTDANTSFYTLQVEVAAQNDE